MGRKLNVLQLQMIRYVNNEKELCTDISHQLVYGSTERRLNVITDIHSIGRKLNVIIDVQSTKARDDYIC